MEHKKFSIKFITSSEFIVKVTIFHERFDGMRIYSGFDLGWLKTNPKGSLKHEIMLEKVKVLYVHVLTEEAQYTFRYEKEDELENEININIDKLNIYNDNFTLSINGKFIEATEIQQRSMMKEMWKKIRNLFVFYTSCS